MKTLFAIAVVSFLLPGWAFAAQVAHGDQYALRKGEQIRDNFYVAGSAVTLEGDITGDLLAAGGNILLSGSVAKDVLIVGGDINITGNIGEDIRVVGGSVTMSGSVGGDVIAAGGQVKILSGATVKGDVVVAGGEVDIEGTVAGQVRAVGDRIVLGGTIGGPVNAQAGRELLVTQTAVLNGTLSYKAMREATIQEGSAISGEVTFLRLEQDKKRFEALAMKAWLVKLFMALATGLVIYFVNRKVILQVVEQASGRFWKELLRGFAAFVLLPLAGVMLMITVLGIPLGVLGLLSFFCLAILAWVFGGILFGNVVAKMFMKKQPELTWYMVVAGITLLSLTSLVPIVGGIVASSFFLVAFGSLVLPLYRRVFPS